MKKTKLLLITNAILVLSVAMFTSCKNAASGGDGERKFSLSNYEKTDFVTVIPKTTTIHMTDDSSWSAYYNGTDNNYKGVFIKDRKVQLSPYAMSAYQVTQELYEAVIGVNPSYFKGNSRQPATGEIQKYRPVEQVTWYDAVNFCNELTKKTMSEADCVYTITDIKKTNNRITNATVTIDISKKGYRLPTEAEWEFAARGGALTAPDWNCAYAGVQTLKSLGSFTNSPYYDEKLEEYG